MAVEALAERDIEPEAVSLTEIFVTLADDEKLKIKKPRECFFEGWLERNAVADKFQRRVQILPLVGEVRVWPSGERR